MKRHAVLALVLFITSSPARADEGRTAADTLFREGKALIEQGKYAEACPKLAESNRLEVGIGTQLYLADCLEQIGRTASAFRTFREAEALARQRGDKREAVARSRAEKLAPNLARVIVDVAKDTEPFGLVVTRDGETLERATWATPTPVDPGAHVIVASAPGRRPFRRTIDATAAQTTSVRIPVLARERDDSKEDAVGSPGLASSQRTLGLVVGGAGLVGLGIGAYFGLHAKSLDDDSHANGHCVQNACDQTGYDLRTDAKHAATVSTIAFVAGAALFAGGAYLFLTAPKGAQVGVGPAGAAVRVAF